MDCEAASDGSTYFAACLPNDLASYEDRNLDCIEGGYDNLASIRDSSEQLFIEDLISQITYTSSDAFVFGYNDEATEGIWVWEDGWGGSYTNWNPGEPNNIGNEDYACIRPFHFGGLWDDNGSGPSYTWSGFVCNLR